VRLTPRETEILGLLANGTGTKTIAGKLGISEKTVNNHVNRLLNKLDAHNRLEAVRRAEKAGLI
jgi:DNA-binding NarL/FixJ family response regulator